MVGKAGTATSLFSSFLNHNYDEIAEKILANGGKVALPKMALVGMAWQRYFLDTEGNTIGLHQADSNAK